MFVGAVPGRADVAQRTAAGDSRRRAVGIAAAVAGTTHDQAGVLPLLFEVPATLSDPASTRFPGAADHNRIANGGSIANGPAYRNGVARCGEVV